MFQLTLGTWVPVARDLQELLSPAFNMFTILFKGVFGFAAVGVINGVFMQETLKVAQTDDIIMMRDVARKEKLGKKYGFNVQHAVVARVRVSFFDFGLAKEAYIAEMAMDWRTFRCLFVACLST